MAEQKFPSEVIDLPSEGKLYPEGHPCKDGKIELKYMTAKEEDILSSQNLITKGVVLDRLFDSLIVTKGVKQQDLLIGDKNAVMVAARVLAYGPEYVASVLHEGVEHEVSFDLSKVDYKPLDPDVEYNGNSFPFTLPRAGLEVKIKLFTGKEEKISEQEITATKKTGISSTVTSRLRQMIVAVGDDTSQATIYKLVVNMLSADSLALREFYARIQPDVILEQEVEIGGDMVKVNIPLTVRFFWPDAGI